MTTLPQALHDARIGCHPCDHEADAERLTDALLPDAHLFSVDSLAERLAETIRYHDEAAHDHAAAIIQAAKEAERPEPAVIVTCEHGYVASCPIHHEGGRA